MNGSTDRPTRPDWVRFPGAGGLPIIGAVADGLGLSALRAASLPDADTWGEVSWRARSGSSASNLGPGREPRYGLGDSPARYDPALFGLTIFRTPACSATTGGAGLGALFDADRASLLTAVLFPAISDFDVDSSCSGRPRRSQGARRVPGRGRTPRGGQANR